MITFCSEVGPDIMMFDAIAQRMMELMGKENAARGVVTVEQMPEIIARLRAALERDRAEPRGDDRADDDEDATPAVGLAQRIVPLIELLEISLVRKVPVLWGV